MYNFPSSNRMNSTHRKATRTRLFAHENTKRLIKYLLYRCTCASDVLVSVRSRDDALLFSMSIHALVIHIAIGE